MSDLREKISDLLEEWRSEINEEATAYDWGCWAKTPDSSYEVADRILALLPKMPELRWDGAQLFLGSLRVGFVAEDRNGQMLLHAGEKTIGGAMPMDMARAAVEAAVRKALGWEA